MVTKKRLVTTFACLRCGHNWMPRKPGKPKRCASCKTPYWEKGDPREDFITIKWIVDGAGTLSAAAKMLRDYAKELEDMEREGWQLVEEINDGYAMVRK